MNHPKVTSLVDELDFDSEEELLVNQLRQKHGLFSPSFSIKPESKHTRLPSIPIQVMEDFDEKLSLDWSNHSKLLQKDEDAFRYEQRELQELASQLLRDKISFEEYKRSELEKLQRSIDETLSRTNQYHISPSYQLPPEQIIQDLKDQLEKLDLSYKKRENELFKTFSEQQKSKSQSKKSSKYSLMSDQKHGNIWNNALSHHSNVKLHVSDLDDFTQQIIFHNGKHERHYNNGVKITIYPNMVIKESIPHSFGDSNLSGHILYYFSSGNIKNMYPNGNIHYTYKSGVTCFVDGTNAYRMYSWPSGQVEKYYGKRFPDDQNIDIPFIFHEIYYPDGTQQQKMNNGQQIIRYSNGNIMYIDSQGGKRLVKHAHQS